MTKLERELFYGHTIVPHDEVACKAFRDYEENAKQYDTNDGRPTQIPLGERIHDYAIKHGVTVDKMLSHRRCYGRS